MKIDCVCFRGLVAGLVLMGFTSGVCAQDATPVKVFLLGGQSNMLGRGQTSGLPTELQGTQDDVLFVGGSQGTAGTTLESLRPDGRDPDEFGPEVTFGRTIADLNPGTQIALIKYARSGSDLHTDWALGTGIEYATFRQTVVNGLTELQDAGYAPEIVGMLWHQGESDAGLGEEAYETRLTAFIADIRGNYGADLPFMIGEIRQINANAIQITNAQADVAAADPYATFVPATDLTFSDNLHFDAAGVITLGERFATAYQTDYGHLVPEPSSLTLIAFCGLYLLQRRRH